MAETPALREQIGIRDVRHLRQAAATLTSTAEWHREALIEQLGLKRYVFNALGKAAHLPASGCLLEWPDRVERVNGVRDKLGDYLYARARKEQRLPQAVVIEEETYYL